MKKYINIIALAGMLTACVTINIYFPAAAADKAADKIIDDVWQLKNGQKEAGPREGTEKTTVTPEVAPIEK